MEGTQVQIIFVGRMVPPTFVYPSYTTARFEACEYTENESPTATITMPSGRSQVIDNGTYAGCWHYNFMGNYGMELETYSLIFDHPQRQLTYSWDVNYPNYRVETGMLGPNQDSIWYVLMGFEPYENVTIDFYGSEDFSEIVRYIATRTVEMDKDGVLIIQLEMARSSPFGNILLMFEDYNKQETEDFDFILEPRLYYDNGLYSRLVVGSRGYVLPGASNRLRDEPVGQVIGTLAPGTGFIVTGEPLCGGL
jgi:hypothetical protein